MTLAEYMDPAKFPLTTQKGLTPQQQMMIDAVNYDELKEKRDAGVVFTSRQAALWAEQEAKHAARPQVAAEANAVK